MMKKLLLADDSITIQKVVGIIFSTEEYQLEMTDDGDSAFKKALEEIPDLVIADISMPGKDGFELCRAIKSEPSLSNTSVLLLPGAFDHFDETKAGEVCADGWLTKPFESQALLDKVSQLLEAEPVRMAGIAVATTEELPVAAQVEEDELGGDLLLNDEVLGLDAMADLAATVEEIDEESPEDIWDAVSFAEEDLQETRTTANTDSADEVSFAEAVMASADAEEDVSFAAAVMDPSMVDDMDIEPATDEQVYSAFAAEVEESEPYVAAAETDFVAADFEPNNTEEFQPETFFGADIEEESATEFKVESAAEAVSHVAEEEAESADFSVFSETEEEAAFVTAAAQDDSLELVDGLDEGSVFEVDESDYAGSGEGSVPDIEEFNPFAVEAAEDEPLGTMGGEFLEQSPDVEIAEEEPVSLVADDAEEIIMELQEDDELEDYEPVIRDARESVAPFAGAVSADRPDDEEIIDLSEDDIVEAEQLEELIDEPVAEEVELFVAQDTEVEPEYLFESADEFVDFAAEEVALAEAVETAAMTSEEENFYFDVAAEDGEEVIGYEVATMAAGVTGIAAGVATARPAAAETGVSATEQVEQQLRELSEEELKAVVTKVSGPLIEKLAREMLEQIAWEVVPDLAEAMIREEIRKIKEGA